MPLHRIDLFPSTPVRIAVSPDSDIRTMLEDLCPGAVLGKEEGGRPFLTRQGFRIACGITHTSGLNAVAVSETTDVGIDCERSDRKVDLRLASRMRHPGDDPDLYPDPLTTWILKESVLKCVGTGLRAGMSSVRLVKGGLPGSYRAAWNGVEFDVLLIDRHPHRIGIAIRTSPP